MVLVGQGCVGNQGQSGIQQGLLLVLEPVSSFPRKRSGWVVSIPQGHVGWWDPHLLDPKLLIVWQKELAAVVGGQ